MKNQKDDNVEWEEEFDKQKLGYLDFCGNEDHECECSVKEEQIKSFIRHLLASSRSQVVETIKKSEITYDKGLEKCGQNYKGHEFVCHYKKGYNQALYDLLEKLKKRITE